LAADVQNPWFNVAEIVKMAGFPAIIDRIRRLPLIWEASITDFSLRIRDKRRIPSKVAGKRSKLLDLETKLCGNLAILMFSASKCFLAYPGGGI